MTIKETLDNCEAFREKTKRDIENLISDLHGIRAQRLKISMDELVYDTEIVSELQTKLRIIYEICDTFDLNQLVVNFKDKV